MTNHSKMRSFQYRLLQGELLTEMLSSKRKENRKTVLLVTNTQSILSTWECVMVKQFKVLSYWACINDWHQIELDQLDIIRVFFNIIVPDAKAVINFFFLVAKHFICRMR